MAEKSGNGTKTKKKSTKKLKRGAERIADWSLRACNGIKKLSERCARWSKKSTDNNAKNTLQAMAHLFEESEKLLSTVVLKSTQLQESGWEAPKFVQNASFNFEKGEPVVIKEKFTKFYSLADKNALANMKIGDALVTSESSNGRQRLSYFIPGIGLIPKAHLEPAQTVAE